MFTFPTWCMHAQHFRQAQSFKSIILDGSGRGERHSRKWPVSHHFIQRNFGQITWSEFPSFFICKMVEWSWFDRALMTVKWKNVLQSWFRSFRMQIVFVMIWPCLGRTRSSIHGRVCLAWPAVSQNRDRKRGQMEAETHGFMWSVLSGTH